MVYAREFRQTPHGRESAAKYRQATAVPARYRGAGPQACGVDTRVDARRPLDAPVTFNGAGPCGARRFNGSRTTFCRVVAQQAERPRHEPWTDRSIQQSASSRHDRRDRVRPDRGRGWRLAALLLLRSRWRRPVYVRSIRRARFRDTFADLGAGGRSAGAHRAGDGADGRRRTLARHGGGARALDGYEFTTYNRRGGALPSNTVLGLAVAGDGTLWVATNAGLVANKDGRSTPWTMRGPWRTAAS